MDSPPEAGSGPLLHPLFANSFGSVADRFSTSEQIVVGKVSCCEVQVGSKQKCLLKASVLSIFCLKLFWSKVYTRPASPCTPDHLDAGSFGASPSGTSVWVVVLCREKEEAIGHGALRSASRRNNEEALDPAADEANKGIISLA